MNITNTTKESIYRRSSIRRPKVLCIYTGGTIGMKKNKEGSYAPVPGYLREITDKTPNFQDPGMPLFEILEFSPLIDSSNIKPQDWLAICHEIDANYAKYDGFVVIHGTDTMSFTASALSFFLRNLSKHVVMTGAQIPLSELYNDGMFNLVGAIYMAGWYEIPEVTLFFAGKLYRGNRTQKYSSWELTAFDSACFPCLAQWGATISVHDELVMWHKELSSLKQISQNKPIEALEATESLEVMINDKPQDIMTHPNKALIIPQKVCNDVVIIYLYPGISGQDILAAVASKRGVILLAYGAGNGPTDDKHFLQAIKTLKSRNVVVIGVTQTHWGLVDLGMYSAGLGRAGAVSGLTMTPSAAYAKLVYLLSIGCHSVEEIEAAMCTDIRGEIETFRASTGMSNY